MKLPLILLVTWLAFILAGLSDAGSDLALSAKCGEARACIPMILNYGEGGASALIRTAPLDGGYTQFWVRVQGRLGGGKNAEHVVSIRGYTDGMKCCDFGQVTVAVTGYTDQTRPVILTNQGPLALANDSLSVGCPDCIEVKSIGTGKRVASYPSPSWDLSLTGHHQEDFHISGMGELYVHQGAACVQLLKNGPMRVVGDEKCQEGEPRDLRLRIKMGACT
jgi:hypothetical protein